MVGSKGLAVKQCNAEFWSDGYPEQRDTALVHDMFPVLKNLRWQESMWEALCPQTGPVQVRMPFIHNPS